MKTVPFLSLVIVITLSREHGVAVFGEDVEEPAGAETHCLRHPPAADQSGKRASEAGNSAPSPGEYVRQFNKRAEEIRNWKRAADRIRGGLYTSKRLDRYGEGCFGFNSKRVEDFRKSDVELLLRLDQKIVAVRLYGNAITDSTAAILSRLKTLRVVRIESPLISDEIMDTLTTLPELHELSLSGNGITDKTLKRLPQLEYLESLTIVSDSLTGRRLKNLAKLKSVSWMLILGENVSLEDARRLFLRLPNFNRFRQLNRCSFIMWREECELTEDPAYVPGVGDPAYRALNEANADEDLRPKETVDRSSSYWRFLGDM